MEGEELKQGRERVRLYLIRPLKDAGMERLNSWKAERETDMLNNLQNRLAYMTVANLEALREVVAHNATGKTKDRWPKELLIEKWAQRLQPRPFSMSRLVRSYIQSGAGRDAHEGGYLVELFFYLRRVGAPPNSFSMAEIRKEAEADRVLRDRAIQARADCRATSQQLKLLAEYETALARCVEALNSKTTAEQVA